MLRLAIPRPALARYLMSLERSLRKTLPANLPASASPPAALRSTISVICRCSHFGMPDNVAVNRQRNRQQNPRVTYSDHHQTLPLASARRLDVGVSNNTDE